MAIKVDSSNFQDNVNGLIPYLDGYEKFDGMSNSELLDFHFDEKVYQFDTHVLENGFTCTLKKIDDIYHVYLQRNIHGYTVTGSNGQVESTHSTLSIPIEIGTVGHRSNHLIDDYLNGNYKCVPLLYGGRYKKVIINEDGSDHVKSFREPYSIKVAFYKKKESEQEINSMATSAEKWDQISKRSEQIGNSLQSAGDIISGCGCILFCIIGLIIFIPLLIVIISSF